MDSGLRLRSVLMLVGTFGVANMASAQPSSVPIDLGSLGGTYSSPSDLNDRGQVVGVSTTAGDARHAVMSTI